MLMLRTNLGKHRKQANSKHIQWCGLIRNNHGTSKNDISLIIDMFLSFWKE